jgi:hypothetical protein
MAGASGESIIRFDFHVMKATLTAALDGQLFGFDTAVISDAIDTLVWLLT